VGEQVLLKLQPYAQSSVVNRPFPKLAFKYFGPYQILEKLGPVAYKLQFPDNSSVHPVFHVSQLKSFTADYSPVHSQLPDTPALDVLNVTPERILDRRLVKKGNVAITQVLVQLTGLSSLLLPGGLQCDVQQISISTSLPTSWILSGWYCHCPDVNRRRA
jgi:hypothetical protein